MQKSKTVFYIVLFSALLCLTGWAGGQAHAADTPTLISKAFAQNDISEADYLFYQIQAALTPQKLPAKYKSVEAPKQHVDLTWFLLSAKLNFNNFTAEQQSYLKTVFARPTDAGDSSVYTTTEATPYCTTNFCVHYVTTTTDAPTVLTDANANGTPDYVENMATDFETSYTTIITTLGYSYNGITDGTKGGNAKVDVYIKQLQSGFLGFATSEDTASSNPLRMTSYITMANSYSSDNIRKVTAAHEFKHTTDMANYAGAPFWWFESTGPWAEDEVYDSINDYAGYVSCWFLYPEVMLDNNQTDVFPDETRNGTNCGGTSGNATLHVYGDTIFIRYLTLKFGTAIEKNLWTQQGASCSTTSTGNALDSKKCTADTIDTYLQTNHSTTLSAAFADFALKNYKILSNNFYGPGDSSAKYETATELNLWFSGNNASNVYVESSHTSFPVSTQTKTLPHMAARYIQFTAPDTNNNVLTISFNGPDSKNFAAKIVLETSAGALTEDAVTLDSTTNDGTYVKAGFGSAYNKIILIPVNTGKITTDGSTDGLTFTYSASNAAFSVPSAPTGVTATAGDAQVALSWTAATAGSFSIASYNVYRSATSGGTQTKINTSAVTSTSYTDTGLTNGTTYFYVVKALDSAGNESSASSEVSATPAAVSTTTAPSAPTGISASAGDTQAAITWASVSGATSYNVYMAAQTGVTASNYSTLTGGMKHTGVTSPYTHTGLTNGTKYYFIVTAANTAGESSASSEVNATPFAKPAAPSGVTATAGDANVTLSWTAPAKTTFDISSYNVYRSATTGTGYAKINSSAVTSASYTDSTVTNGTKYFYVVTAVDSQSNESANSSEVNAAPAAAATTTTTTISTTSDIPASVQTTLSTQVTEGQSIALIDPATPSATVTLAGKVNPNNPGGAKFAPAIIQIEVEVYALNGNRVASATTTADANGFYVLKLSSDFNGKPLANGIYACRTVIRADGVVVSQKMSKIVVYR